MRYTGGALRQTAYQRRTLDADTGFTHFHSLSSASERELSVGGLWQDRVGPRRVAFVAGILYGVGYMVAALGASNHSLAEIYLGYGAIAGFGMGMGYICPVATLVKWFPERRGLMTGVAVCGYGAGALVMSPLAAKEILSLGVRLLF